MPPETADCRGFGKCLPSVAMGDKAHYFQRAKSKEPFGPSWLLALTLHHNYSICLDCQLTVRQQTPLLTCASKTENAPYVLPTPIIQNKQQTNKKINIRDQTQSLQKQKEDGSHIMTVEWDHHALRKRSRGVAANKVKRPTGVCFQEAAAVAPESLKSNPLGS